MGRNDFELGRNDSELGRNDSKLGRNDSELGRNDSELGRNDSELGRNDSELGRNDLGRNGLGTKRPVSGEGNRFLHTEDQPETPSYGPISFGSLGTLTSYAG